MENPIKSRRLNANFTQDQLAREAEVVHDNVVRNEQGLFTTPSPRLLSIIAKISGDSTEAITREYTAWVSAKRRNGTLKTALQRVISFDKAEKLKQHPFLLWRVAIFPGQSRIAFCQMLCIHPATVLKYETGKQGPMPSQIYEALLAAGMKEAAISDLAYLAIRYFRAKRFRITNGFE